MNLMEEVHTLNWIDEIEGHVVYGLYDVVQTLVTQYSPEELSLDIMFETDPDTASYAAMMDEEIVWSLNFLAERENLLAA